MTRRSRRELEHALNDLAGSDDAAAREIRVEETIVGTEWSPDESDDVLDAGETRTESWVVGGGESR